MTKEEYEAEQKALLEYANQTPAVQSLLYEALPKYPVKRPVCPFIQPLAQQSGTAVRSDEICG